MDISDFACLSTKWAQHGDREEAKKKNLVSYLIKTLYKFTKNLKNSHTILPESYSLITSWQKLFDLVRLNVILLNTYFQSERWGHGVWIYRTEKSKLN